MRERSRRLTGLFDTCLTAKEARWIPDHPNGGSSVYGSFNGQPATPKALGAASRWPTTWGFSDDPSDKISHPRRLSVRIRGAVTHTCSGLVLRRSPCAFIFP